MAKAVVDQAKCLGCAACTGVCPAAAIAIDASGKAAVDPSKCAGCGQCAKICPAQAIENK